MDMGFVQGPMSSAQLRKIRKPIIERRRRERINRCLDQIKSLVLKALNQDESKYEKMDKADILEMAVRHLMESSPQRAPLSGAYSTGYTRCASEVKDFLHHTSPASSQEMEKRLLGHLGHGASPRAASTPAGICRPQPVLAHTVPAMADGEHKVTVMTRHNSSLEEEDSCLNCSTVSSTSSSSSSSALSPAHRQRHDSSLSEDYCQQDRCPTLECVSTSDIHDYTHSAFRQVPQTGAQAQCQVLEVCHVDSDNEEQLRAHAQQDCQGSSPVWRPW